MTVCKYHSANGVVGLWKTVGASDARATHGRLTCPTTGPYLPGLRSLCSAALESNILLGFFPHALA